MCSMIVGGTFRRTTAIIVRVRTNFRRKRRSITTIRFASSGSSNDNNLHRHPRTTTTTTTTTTTSWKQRNGFIPKQTTQTLILQRKPPFLFSSCVCQRHFGSYRDEDEEDPHELDHDSDGEKDHEDDLLNPEENQYTVKWDSERNIPIKKKKKKRKKDILPEMPEPTYEIHPISGLVLSPHAKRIQITNIPTYLNDLEAALIQKADKYPPIANNSTIGDDLLHRTLDEDAEFDLRMRLKERAMDDDDDDDDDGRSREEDDLYYDDEDTAPTIADIRNRRPVKKLQDELLFLLALEKVPATIHFITQHLWKRYPHDKIILITELEETARDFFAEFEQFVPDAEEAALWHHRHLVNSDRKFLLRHFADPHHPSKVLIAPRGSFRADVQIPIANHVIFHDLPWRVSHYTNSMDRVQVWDQSKHIYEYWITANTQFDQNKMHVFSQRLMHYQTTMHAKEEAKDHGQAIVHDEDYTVPDIRITWKDILGIDGVEPIPRRVRKIQRLLNKKKMQRKKKKRDDPLISGLTVENENRLTTYRDPEHDKAAWQEYPAEIPIIKRD